MKMLFNKKVLKKVQCALLAMCMLISILSVGVGASAAEPVIKTVTLNETRTVATIQFSGQIAEATGVNIKSKIKLSQDGGSESSLAPFSTVTVRSDAIVVNLPEPLTKKTNYFVIEADALQNQPRRIVTANINASDPVLSQSKAISIDKTKKKVTITFSGAISGYPSDSSLKNGYISLARDGKNFTEIIKSDQVTVNGASGQIIITLNTALDGYMSKFKISQGKVQSKSTGNVNLSDVITPAVNALDTNAPELIKSEVKSDGGRIILTFDKNIRRTSGVNTSMFKSSVTISRNGGYYSSLSSYDEVEVEGNTLIIKLYYPVTGNNNRICVKSGVISDVTSGDPILQDIYSDYFNMGGEVVDGGPEYSGIVYDKENKMVRIYFDREIRAVSTQKLLGGIDIYLNNTWETFDSYKNIEIYKNNSILITMRDYLSGTVRFRVDGNTLQDYDGNIQKNNLYTDYVDEYGTGNYTDEISSSKEDDTQTGDDGKSEDDAQEDNKQEDGKEDNENDNAIDNENENKDDNVSSGDQVKEVTVTLNGAVVDFASNNMSTDGEGNTNYTVKIDSASAKPKITVKGQGVVLTAIMPTDADGGTLSIPGDIIEMLCERNGSISIECATAVHQISLSLIDMKKIKNELKVDDASNIAVDISVNRAPSVYSSDLQKAADDGGYTVIASPTDFTIQYKSTNTTRAITKFNEYVEKSFVVPAQLVENMATVVRVETSGAVNHVPSHMSRRANGDAYLVARTRQNGVYAVISGDRTFSDTPTWAVEAVNSLASRQILGDFSGRKMSPSQAATRAEVASIVSKGMGIYTDKSGASKFLDVTLTDSYYIATAVAVEYGLINGYGDNTFKPECNITRQEAIAILARTSRLAKNLSVTESTTLTKSQADELVGKFSDANDVAEWAKMDVAECVQEGIIRGDNNNRINPNSNVTRAELVQMVYNLLVQYGYIGK